MKEELLSYIDTHIHPSSPHRRVLSVHVKSQAKQNVANIREQLLGDDGLLIAGEGYDVRPPDVEKAIEREVEPITQNLQSLNLTHGYDQEQMEQSLAKWTHMFESQLAKNGEPTGAAAVASVLNEVTVEDIDKLRRTLKVDDKPAPVQQLQTFFESL